MQLCARRRAWPLLLTPSSFVPVQQLMLAAQAVAPEDPDVAVVLGVLYNVSRDFDSAIACFETATAARGGDYALWNKLGATRANGAKSEDALPAYYKALELKPKVRSSAPCSLPRAWARAHRACT